MAKKTLRIVSGILISLFFLWLAFRKSDFGQIWDIIKTARFELLAIAFAVAVLSLMMRSLRWKNLGREYKNVPWKMFFEATSIGLMLNNFVPFRGGDLFQGYFLSKKSSLPKTYTLATVFLERLMDLAPPALMIIIGSYFIVIPAQVKIGRILVLFALIIAAILLFLKFRKIFISFIEKFIHEKHSEKIEKLLENIASAIKFLKDRQVLSVAVPLTLANWFILSALSTYLMLSALNISVSFIGLYLIIGISILSVAIPSSPGYVGTWEFFTMMALSIFGIEKEQALAYAVLSHFLALLPTTIFGLYFFFREMVLKKEKLSDALKEK